MKGPSIRWLLVGTNAFVLAVPVLALLTLRIYENYLVRQTERQLIGQSVVLGEMWRDLWAEESGRQDPPEFRPPDRLAQEFIPIEPVLDLWDGYLPPQPPPTRLAQSGDTPARRAGARMNEVLRRAQVFNLSAARLLDEQGCVVATSRGEDGLCLDSLPEVAAALNGKYAAVARARVSDEPLPPVSDVRSRGSIRIFTALPVFANGKVVGVVRMSRTSLDALTSLWHNRRGLLLLGSASLGFMVALSLLFATLISRPLRRITRAARAIARGEPHGPLATQGFVPEELATLSEALVAMTQKLEARAAYIADFATQVSHELKSPITAIRGAAELLTDEWAKMSDAQRARFLANIDGDAARMERLVMRLLHLARIEHVAEPAGNVAVRDFFSELAGRYGNRVSIHFDSPVETVGLHADLLTSAVENLVENALRFDGGQPVLVRVGSEGPKLVVDVRDHGPGISSNNERRIFERFFTTARDQGGTGLGLTIVRAIAERRGGSIRFVTGPSGTTFTLVL